VIEECILNVPHVILPLNCSSVVICNTDFVCKCWVEECDHDTCTHMSCRRSHWRRRRSSCWSVQTFIYISVCVCIVFFFCVVDIFSHLKTNYFCWVIDVMMINAGILRVVIDELYRFKKKFWWIFFCSNKFVITVSELSHFDVEALVRRWKQISKKLNSANLRGLAEAWWKLLAQPK
jgi:hypothetical protein